MKKYKMNIIKRKRMEKEVMAAIKRNNINELIYWYNRLKDLRNYCFLYADLNTWQFVGKLFNQVADIQKK